MDGIRELKSSALLPEAYSRWTEKAVYVWGGCVKVSTDHVVNAHQHIRESEMALLVASGERGK